MRGVSALAVVLIHFHGRGAQVFSHGYLAVDLFFLMSGAVIAHAYEARLTSGWTVAAFMGERVRRLAPLYLAGTAIGAGCAGFAHSQGFGGDGPVLPNLILGALFIPAVFGGADLFPLNTPSWSLFAEMGANLAYGATVRTLTLGKLILVGGLGAAAVALVTTRSGISADLGWSAGNWVGGAARVTFGFPVGVAIYRLHASGRLRVPALPAWVLLAIAAASFAAPWRGPAYDLGVILLLFPMLTLAGLGARPAAGWSAGALAGAGALSYPLYALHYPIAKLAILYMPQAGALSWVAEMLAAAGLVLFAEIARRGFDAPVQARLKAWRCATGDRRAAMA